MNYLSQHDVPHPLNKEREGHSTDDAPLNFGTKHKEPALAIAGRRGATTESPPGCRRSPGRSMHRRSIPLCSSCKMHRVCPAPTRGETSRRSTVPFPFRDHASGVVCAAQFLVCASRVREPGGCPSALVRGADRMLPRTLSDIQMRFEWDVCEGAGGTRWGGGRCSSPWIIRGDSTVIV